MLPFGFRGKVIGPAFIPGTLTYEELIPIVEAVCDIVHVPSYTRIESDVPAFLGMWSSSHVEEIPFGRKHFVFADPETFGKGDFRLLGVFKTVVAHDELTGRAPDEVDPVAVHPLVSGETAFLNLVWITADLGGFVL